MRIELLWFDGCPNHEAVREDLDRALGGRGLDVSLVKSIRVDETSAASVRFPGSPTIRVNGDDIEPGFRDEGDYSLRCRLYPTSRGLRGVPEREWIEHAIERALAG